MDRRDEIKSKFAEERAKNQAKIEEFKQLRSLMNGFPKDVLDLFNEICDIAIEELESR